MELVILTPSGALTAQCIHWLVGGRVGRYQGTSACHYDMDHDRRAVEAAEQLQRRDDCHLRTDIGASISDEEDVGGASVHGPLARQSSVAHERGLVLL